MASCDRASTRLWPSAWCAVIVISTPSLFITACGGTPTAPSTSAPTASVNPSPVPTPTLVTRRLSGIVRDDLSRPIADARVAALGADQSRTVATTDGSGFYDLTASLNSNYVVPWYYLTVSKPGYEETANGALFRNNEDTKADFFLFRQARLTAGVSDQFIIASNGPLCGFEQEYPCRHVEVVAPANGTMIIEAVAGEPTTEIGLGPVRYPMGAFTRRLTQVVRAGDLVTVEVLMSWTWWPTAQPGMTWFTLRTSLEQ